MRHQPFSPILFSSKGEFYGGPDPQWDNAIDTPYRHMGWKAKARARIARRFRRTV